MTKTQSHTVQAVDLGITNFTKHNSLGFVIRVHIPQIPIEDIDYGWCATIFTVLRCEVMPAGQSND
ncbi:hypothetical protein KIN20_010063 [Parelaphostrongylus tenuis]|uniref:Uncharacterized protein n=1 Tax=Parelaphostrongylus tenuis TaxID=148309 RepID=A0AAD5MQ12_PARTN|nr:hypothetical protein KIN20_010063 [Parelaphostrongylus tenuis]